MANIRQTAQSYQFISGRYSTLHGAQSFHYIWLMGDGDVKRLPESCALCAEYLLCLHIEHIGSEILPEYGI